MTGSIARLRALVDFDIRRRAREWTTPVAAAVFAIVLAAGHGAHEIGPAAPTGDRMFGYAYLLGALLGLRAGLADDRNAGFDEFLVANFVPWGLYLAAKAVTILALLAVAGAYAFGIALAASAGDAAYAAWYTLLFTLTGWLFAPALLAVEMVVDTRFPGMVVLILVVGTAIAVDAYADAALLVDVLGLRVRRMEFATLAPLALRCVIVVPALLLALGRVGRRRIEPARSGRRTA